jgi:hypothetical protein
MAMTRKIASDHSAYLIRAEIVRRPSDAIATDISAANTTMAHKWLNCVPLAEIQPRRPSTISTASIAPIKFTSPAAATNRVP